MAFSPDGKTHSPASGSGDNTIKLWDLEKGGEPLTFTDEAPRRRDRWRFQPRRQDLGLSGSEDHLIKALGSAEGRRATYLHCEPMKIRSKVGWVAFSPDGKILCSRGSSWDDTIKLWDLREGRRHREPTEALGRSLDSVAFSPDGRTLSSGSWDNTIKLWDLEKGGESQTLTGHRGHITVWRSARMAEIWPAAVGMTL